MTNTPYQKLIAILCILTSCYAMPSCSKSTGRNGENDSPGQAVSNGSIKFKHVLGVNGFEWDFSVNNYDLDSIKTGLIKPFGEFRHYLDWHRIETTEGNYAFSPTLSGGWDYDATYTWCKNNGVNVVACLKTVPDWFQNKYYPENEQDAENVPAPFTSDWTDPASYLQFAQLGFQFAARYGSNPDVDLSLVSVAPEPHWSPNQKKVGLDLITYIECNNEPNRWWKGKKAQQSPEEYAANLSAFYDGHKGTLGPGVGVKSADPNMQVVMGGLAGSDVDFIKRMVAWCAEHRGHKNDGTVDLCFDVLNYHYYSNNMDSDWSKRGIRGEAPELSDAVKHARANVAYAQEALGGMNVWVTELGYDVNASSPQRAIPIGDKSVLETQADWIIRSSLLYAREGVNKIHFYMLNDVDANSTIQYASSGFVDEEGKRRPSLDYILQTRELIGEYTYSGSLNKSPFVDLYTLEEKKIYVLGIPDERGKTEKYQLEVPGVKSVNVHELQIGSDKMKTTTRQTVNDKIELTVTETPIFVEVL